MLHTIRAVEAGLPALKTLDGDGIRFEPTPEARAELVAQGALLAKDASEQPGTG